MLSSSIITIPELDLLPLLVVVLSSRDLLGCVHWQQDHMMVLAEPVQVRQVLALLKR
jgi:hypothetical protein